MGFLPQVVIWIHKVQYRIVLSHKSKLPEVGQVVRILKKQFFIFLHFSELREAVIMGVFKLDWVFSGSSDPLDPSLSIWCALCRRHRGHSRLSPKSNLCKSFCFLELRHFSWLFVECDMRRWNCFHFVLDKCILSEKNTTQFIQL